MSQSRQIVNKNTTKIGNLGESVACEYLLRRGHSILERNFRKKFGEIDVISQKQGVVHFIEVKTVTHKTKKNLEWAVTHETWRPEEQVHRFKLRQIAKTLEAWLAEHTHDGEWQVGVVAVRLVEDAQYAVVNYLENVTS